MLERLLIAGQGGQGVVSAGRMLASVAMNHVEHITFFPAYGAEVRGGTSNCQVVLSSSNIASPVCEQFDSMILMNEASVERFLPYRLPETLVIAEQTAAQALSGESGLVVVNAADIARSSGSVRSVNLVLLGVYLGHRHVVPVSDMERAVTATFASKGPSIVDMNIKALRAGLEQAM